MKETNRLIIDAHNHVGGPDKGDHAEQSSEEIAATMDKVGIDKAVIFPINHGVSFSLANNYIASAMKKYPDSSLVSHLKGESVCD